jgi:hypothetical protein
MTETIFTRPVFAVGGRHYDWGDVVLASLLWGEWARLEAEVHEGIACAKRSEALEAPLPADALDEAAAAFRYERDLISAQAMYTWLETRGLTVKGWLDYIRRLVLRRDSPEALRDAVARYPVSEVEVIELIPVEGFCSGRFDRLARKLAGRAAAFDRMISEAGDTAPAEEGEVRELVESVPPGAAERALSDLSPDLSRERLTTLACLELGFRRFRDATLSARALADRVSLHRLDWIRFSCRALALPNGQAAREAAMCLREDGAGLADVAAMARAPLRETCFCVDELDAGLREHFLGARPGELLGPMPMRGEFVLFEVVDKVVPSQDDPEIRRRAEDAIMRSAVSREIHQRVTWEFPM